MIMEKTQERQKMFNFRFLSPFILVLFLPIGLLIFPTQQKSSTIPLNQETDIPSQNFITPTPAITPVPTPIVLTMSNPSDPDLIQFISIEHIGVDPEATEKLIREDVDVTGDGKKDIIFGGTTYGGRVPFLAILSQPSNETPWQLIFYSDENSKYWANVRINVEENRIVADFLIAGGGTGYFELIWRQHWIECGRTECMITWEYPVLRTWQTASGPIREISRGYQTTEFKQQNPETIQLIVHHFSLENVPYDEADDYLVIGADRTYWSIGPKLQQTFHRDDDVYTLVAEEQIIPNIQTVQQFDEQANATTLFLSDILNKQNESYAEYKIAWAEFWGLPLPEKPSDPVWGAWHQKVDAAATDGFKNQYRVDDKTANWVAGVTSAIDRPLCRLTIQNYREEQFELKGRIEVPCISNLTRLDYADVNNDGVSEVLFLTITPEGENPATVQRLYIYSVEDDGLREITTFDGTINGPDMAGVRWEQSPKGFKVFTGLPLVDLNCATDDWSCITLERQFETYVWNNDIEEFEILLDEK
jgi:hypothetical protein